MSLQQLTNQLPLDKHRPLKKYHMDNPPTYPEALNAAVYLIENSKKIVNPDHIIFYVDNDESWTYGKFYNTVNSCAYYLKNFLNLQPGERILAHAYNSPWLAVLWFASLKVGGIIILTPPQLKSKELHYIISHSGASIAFADRDIFEELKSAANSLNCIRAIRTIESTLQLLPLDPIDNSNTSFSSKKNDIALIAYTSGSTGTPKATAHTHLDVLTICDLFPQEILQPSKDDIFAGTPPLGFTFGLGGLLLFPIRYGAASLLLKKPTPAVLSEAINTVKVTILFSTPTGYRMLLHHCPSLKWPSLRLCVAAGEHLPQSTYLQWKEKTGLSLINAIGSTEMLHIFICVKDQTSPPNCTGKPIAGYQAKIIDENDLELEANKVGFLAIQGPTGCCYLGNEVAQSKYVKDGWNITGDLFYKDASGNFYFYDRSDDLIITSGYKVSAVEVENALLSFPGIIEAAVVGVDDALRNKIIKAYLILNETLSKKESIMEEIKSYISMEIAAYKCPREYEIVTTLPKTSTGKIRRFTLRNS